MDEKILKAIEDAKDFLSVVADDRDNAYINYERQEEVVEILESFIKEQRHHNNTIHDDGQGRCEYCNAGELSPHMAGCPNQDR